jgi:hypothetical protein
MLEFLEVGEDIDDERPECGLVGGDFCGAEVVELFDFGCAERAIVDADVV